MPRTPMHVCSPSLHLGPCRQGGGWAACVMSPHQGQAVDVLEPLLSASCVGLGQRLSVCACPS